jgi:hypothetical protein
MTNRNGSPWSASQALAWIICQKPLKLEERQWTEDMSPNLEQAQQKLAAAIGSGEVQAWGRREPHPMLEQIPRDPFCCPGRPVIVAPLGDMRALLPHKYQYDGPRWHVTEFDAAQIKRVFPKSPLAAAREWMLKNASKDQKRYSLLQECMKATGCKRREAEAIYKQLPDELRSPRGRPIRNSEQPPAAARHPQRMR